MVKLIKRRDEMYLVRRETRSFDDILTGRENTLWVNGECFQTDELIRFVEIIDKKRTGRECYCRVEHVYARRLVKIRKVREIHANRQNKKNQAKRKIHDRFLQKDI